MFCGTRSSNRIPSTTTGAAARQKESDYIARRRVFGTWDFKWPQGTEIRVAFQRLSPDHPANKTKRFLVTDQAQMALFQRVEKQAQQWCAPLAETGGPQPNIKLRFLNDRPTQWWPAPTGPRWTQSMSPGEGAAYDVLVSLTPLDPVQEPDSDEGIGAVHRFPQAQLGTYSRRVAQGIPTVYLGRPQYMRDDAARARSIDEYFASNQFGHCIVHEFGHVLGLAHEHQNPRANPRWKDVFSIIALFKAQTGMTDEALTERPDSRSSLSESFEDFVQRQVLEPWPVTKIPTASGGYDFKFSDWRDPPTETADHTYDFDSIMADPMWRCFADYVGMAASVQNGSCVDNMFDIQAPTLSDRQQLFRMYPSV